LLRGRPAKRRRAFSTSSIPDCLIARSDDMQKDDRLIVIKRFGVVRPGYHDYHSGRSKMGLSRETRETPTTFVELSCPLSPI
jgi:hypothetical protein